jgi:hypothetical protein
MINPSGFRESPISREKAGLKLCQPRKPWVKTRAVLRNPARRVPEIYFPETAWKIPALVAARARLRLRASVRRLAD